MRIEAARPPKPESPLRRKLFELGYGRQIASPLWKPVKGISWMIFMSLLVVDSPAVKGYRFTALLRFWCCQILRRLNRSFDVHLPEGAVIRCPPWSAIGCLLAAVGTHEPSEDRFVQSFVRPGDGVIDAGSNIGAYAVPLAAKGAYVAAFEPSSKARASLLTNIELNGVTGQVRVYAEALSDFDGEAFFTNELDLQNYLVLPDGSESRLSSAVEKTRVTTIDSIVFQDPWFQDHPPLLMKIDVEGEDAKVLRGSERTLAAFRPIILVESNLGGSEIRAFLEGMKYAMYWFDQREPSLVELPTDWAGNYQFHTNLIAIPSERLDLVVQRLENIPTAPPNRPRVKWGISSAA